MNALATFDTVQELSPASTSAELDLRRKLHGYGNAASAMIASTQSPEARALAWMALEWASGAKFAHLSERGLTEIAKFTRRLMLTAIQAEAINDELEAADGI